MGLKYILERLKGASVVTFIVPTQNNGNAIIFKSIIYDNDWFYVIKISKDKYRIVEENDGSYAMESLSCNSDDTTHNIDTFNYKDAAIAAIAKASYIDEP
jgi:hypothetical protein